MHMIAVHGDESPVLIALGVEARGYRLTHSSVML
jgi:hypothetical protein